MLDLCAVAPWRCHAEIEISRIELPGVGTRCRLLESLAQVSAGVGVLAGSTVMLLTFPWFIAIVCSTSETPQTTSTHGLSTLCNDWFPFAPTAVKAGGETQHAEHRCSKNTKAGAVCGVRSTFAKTSSLR